MQRKDMLDTGQVENIFIIWPVQYARLFDYWLSFVVDQLRLYQTLTCVSHASNRLFSPLLDGLLKPLGEELVLKTALGDINRVRDLLKISPRLVLVSATVQDYSYRTLQNKVALQVAYGANHSQMFNLILSAYGKIPHAYTVARKHLNEVIGEPPKPYVFDKLLDALGRANKKDISRVFNSQASDRPLDQALCAFRRHFSRQLVVSSQHFNMDDLLCVLKWGADFASRVALSEAKAKKSAFYSSGGGDDDRLETSNGVYSDPYKGARNKNAILDIFERFILAYLFEQLPAHYLSVIGRGVSDYLSKNLKAGENPFLGSSYYPLLGVVGGRLGLGLEVKIIWRQKLGGMSYDKEIKRLLETMTKLHKFHVDEINERLFELGIKPAIQKEARTWRRV